MDIRNVIKKPLVTEKASKVKEQNNKYTFVVDRNANKYQVRQAVEELFKVKVDSIRTANYSGKEKRMGKSSGYKNDWKKAIVKLVAGQEIQIAEEA
jgi:large subunit ribosomal protein L23